MTKPDSVQGERVVEQQRIRMHALEAQAALETVVGLMRLGSEFDPLPRLEAALDHIKRIVDGEDYEERWAALASQHPEREKE